MRSGAALDDIGERDGELASERPRLAHEGPDVLAERAGGLPANGARGVRPLERSATGRGAVGGRAAAPSAIGSTLAERRRVTSRQGAGSSWIVAPTLVFSEASASNTFAEAEHELGEVVVAAGRARR